MFGRLRHPFRCATLLVGFLFSGVLVGCNQQHATDLHWKEVRRLTDTAMEVHFVVVELPFVRDRKTLENAGDSLCENDPCQIGFWLHASDVPAENLAADFFTNNGWQDRHEVALFFRNRNSNLQTLQWDCNVVPRPILNDCLSSPAGPSLTLEAARKRGVLNGFGKLQFGMTVPKAVHLLGGDDAVTILDQGNGRTIVRAQAVVHGQSFDAYYNFASEGFRLVLLKWDKPIDEKTCAAEAEKIADDLVSDYGKQERFAYYDSEQTEFLYSWLFANGATIKLSKTENNDGDCPLNLEFEAKSDSD